MSRCSLLLSLWFAVAASAQAVPAAPPPTPAAKQAAAIAGAVPAPAANWAQTLERIATGVVTIQIDSTRAFDTEWNSTAQATGFVIVA